MATSSSAEKEVQTKQNTLPNQDTTEKPVQCIVGIERGPILAKGRHVLEGDLQLHVTQSLLAYRQMHESRKRRGVKERERGGTEAASV